MVCVVGYVMGSVWCVCERCEMYMVCVVYKSGVSVRYIMCEMMYVLY